MEIYFRQKHTSRGWEIGNLFGVALPGTPSMHQDETKTDIVIVN